MGLAAASVFVLKLVAAWIALQWVLQVVGERVPRVRPVVAAMKVVDDFALVAFTTLCALLVLLPSFVFVVLEVFRYVQVRSRARPAKTVADYMERIVDIVNELEVMGDRMRASALTLLNSPEEESTTTVCGNPFRLRLPPFANKPQEEVLEETACAPEPAVATSTLPQICGNVLLAVCRHSESLERLYAALQPPSVDVSIANIMWPDIEQKLTRLRNSFTATATTWNIAPKRSSL
jgi:hypothetical protein